MGLARGLPISLLHFVQTISRIALTCMAAGLSLNLAVAGPLGFPDQGLVEHSPVLSECAFCAFIAAVDDIPLQTDPRQAIIVYGWMALLMLIGFVGVRRRVRARPWRTA